MRKLLLLAVLVAVAQPAHGQPHSGEVRHPRGRLFISPAGEPFRGPDGLSAWFGQADADHDGAVTAADFQADAERAFRLYDADGDGRIGALEIQAYERERAPEITEFAFASDQPRGRGERPAGAGTPFRGAGASGAARFSLLNEPEPLLAADEDVDGKVTRAEWSRATTRRFERLDRDHAGRLTLAALRGGSPRR